MRDEGFGNPSRIATDARGIEGSPYREILPDVP